MKTSLDPQAELEPLRSACFIKTAEIGFFRAIGQAGLPAFLPADRDAGLTFGHGGQDNCGSGLEDTA